MEGKPKQKRPEKTHMQVGLDRLLGFGARQDVVQRPVQRVAACLLLDRLRGQEATIRLLQSATIPFRGQQGSAADSQLNVNALEVCSFCVTCVAAQDKAVCITFVLAALLYCRPS